MTRPWAEYSRFGPSHAGGDYRAARPGDEDVFAQRMAGQHYADRAVSPLGGRQPRPEPQAIQGQGSSLTLAQGSAGRQRGHGAGSRWQA